MSQWLSRYSFLIVPALTWVVAQAAKVVINGLTQKGWSWRYLYRSGGMPSAHTSVIVSLCTVLGAERGLASPEFGIAAVLASIVMYDAVNVRHAVGEQAKALRVILPEVFKNGHPPQMIVHQSNGHTPVEVGAGFFIGVAFPLLLLNVM